MKCSVILLRLLISSGLSILLISPVLAETEATAPCLKCQETPAAQQSLNPLYPEELFGKCPTDAQVKLTASGFFTKLLSKKKPWETLQDSWAEYNRLMNLRIGANSKLLDQKLSLGKSPVVFLAGIERLNPMTKALDQLDSDGTMAKLLAMPVFKVAAGNSDFLKTLRDVDFSNPTNKLSRTLGLYKNPSTLQAIKTIQDTLRDEGNFKLVTIMVRNNLSLLDKDARQNAEQLKKFMNDNGVDYARIQTWRDQPPLMKDIPYPRSLTGVFANSYKQFVQAEVTNFLTSNPLSATDLEAFKKGSSIDLNAVNSATTPTDGEHVAYDAWIHPLHQADQSSQVIINGKSMLANPSQLEAIDAVARTIWGEAQGCAAKGLPQFEAIGRVICERAQDVKRSIDEQAKVKTRNEDLVTQFNNSAKGSDSVGTAELMVKLSSNQLQGLSDFGRKDALQLDPAIQVISKPLQFSIWNSSRNQYLTLGNLNSKKSTNIPDVSIAVQMPQGSGDDSALLNVVCPAKEQFPQLWSKALDLAKQIVLTPDDYLKNYRFNTTARNVLFYTHEFDLPFAQEVKIDSFMLPSSKTPVSLRENPPGKVVSGSCGQFRLFTPKNGGNY